jgi:hypothetical protein
MYGVRCATAELEKHIFKYEDQFFEPFDFTYTQFFNIHFILLNGSFVVHKKCGFSFVTGKLMQPIYLCAYVIKSFLTFLNHIGT